MKHLTPEQNREIVKAYTEDMVSAIDLAKKYGRTRQGIWKLLKRNGINPADHVWLKLVCLHCEKPFERRRCYVRNAGKLAYKKREFCTISCYYVYINKKQGGEYVPSRQGCRVGREVVRKYIVSNNILPPYGNVLHHIDRNCYNNDISNLMTFKDNSDHMKYHRGVDVEPVFDGSKL